MAHLTQQEMIDFTGTDTPTKQKNVLKKNKIPWADRHDGTITTTTEAINAALLGDSANDDCLDWDAI